MKQVQDDVWETGTESPFPGLTTHAYLLTRADGTWKPGLLPSRPAHGHTRRTVEGQQPV
jgi:hypothetical protein